jgi:hypothetical protein
MAAGLALSGACAPNAFEVTLNGQTTIHGDPAVAGSLLTRIPAIGSFASVDFGASEEFKQNEVTKDAVQSIKLTQVEMKVVSPDTQGFDFLDELQFFASDGSTETLVAEKTNISGLGLTPPNPVLSLEVNQGAELREYLGSPSVSLTVRGSGRVPRQDTTLQATVKLRVVLKVL